MVVQFCKYTKTTVCTLGILDPSKASALSVFNMYPQIFYSFVAVVNKIKIILFRRLSFSGTVLKGEHQGLVCGHSVTPQGISPGSD